MSSISKGISMFLLSIAIMALLITTVLGFMLGLSHPLPWFLILILILIPCLHERIISRQLIEWNDDMSVGIELIDNDHKTLIEIINQIQRASLYKVDSSSLESIMNKLISYTKTHFDREEYLMEINDYPDLIAHKKLHAEMITKISSCMDKYKNNPDKSLDDALEFLKTWLINHIKGSDREYIPYMKNIDLTGHQQHV